MVHSHWVRWLRNQPHTFLLSLQKLVSMFNFHIFLHNRFSFPCQALSLSAWIHHENGDNFVNFVHYRGRNISWRRMSDSNSLFLHAASSLVRICVSGSAQYSSSVRPLDWLSAADFRFLWRLVLFFWLLTRKILSNYWLLRGNLLLESSFFPRFSTFWFKQKYAELVLKILISCVNIKTCCTRTTTVQRQVISWQCFPIRMRSVLGFCARVGWCWTRPVYKLTVPKTVVE